MIGKAKVMVGQIKEVKTAKADFKTVGLIDDSYDKVEVTIHKDLQTDLLVPGKVIEATLLIEQNGFKKYITLIAVKAA